MVNKLVGSKGNSSVGFILGFTVVLVFVFIPIIMFMIERIAVIIVADDIKNDVNQSFLSVYVAMGDGYSKRQIELDPIALKRNFELLLDKNLQTGEDVMVQKLSEIRYEIEAADASYGGHKITIVSFTVEVTLKSFLAIAQRENNYTLQWRKELPVNY